MKGLIDYENLGRAVGQKRHELDATMREVARVTGLSPATLCRIEHGLSCGAETYETLCRWLKVPGERFVRGRENLLFFPDEPTPDKVEASLLRDQTLTRAEAVALAGLFRVAYRTLVPQAAMATVAGRGKR